jgi:uroporphyrinogen-III synthase
MRSDLTVALFRARDEARASAAALAERGFTAALAPVTELVATGAEPPLAAFDFAVATSAHALALASPAALAAARGLPLHVVGGKTAAAAARAGLAAQATAPDVAALVPGLPPGRALYLAGRDRKPDLEAALAGRLEAVVVYEARARDGWSDEERAAVAAARAALHYSERSAELAFGLAEGAGLAAAFRRMPHVGLSRAVAGRLAALGAKRVMFPPKPAQEPLFDALEAALADYGGRA